MEEPINPDTPSSPDQPAEEIPETPLTLAEKHIARRQTFRELVAQTVEAAEAAKEQPVAEEASAEALDVQDQPAPTGAQPEAPSAELSVLDALFSKARAFTQRVGQSVRRLSQKLTQRAQPLQAEMQTAPAEEVKTSEVVRPPEAVEEAAQGVQAIPMEPAARRSRNVWSPRQKQLTQEVQAAQEQPPAQLSQKVWARSRPFLWRGRIGPAFWTVASTFSLAVNIILIVILILLGRQLFFLKKQVVSDQLINGLYNNFVLMDKAHIQTTITVSDTIQVKDTIPVVFDLPLDQKTTVVLTKDTPVNNATIYLNGQAVPLDLVLREGTELGIKLDMTVPVKQTVPVVLNVPVNLQVPVDIPLNQTELHKPFVGLQQVVSPFRKLLGDLPNSWSEVCKGPMKIACSILRFK